MNSLQIILALYFLILPFCMARPSAMNERETGALEDNGNPSEDETQNSTDEQETSRQDTEDSDGEAEPENDTAADEVQNNSNSEENSDPAQSETDMEGPKEVESVEQNSVDNESDSANESVSQSEDTKEETSQAEESITPEATSPTEETYVTEATVNQPVADQVSEVTISSEDTVTEKSSVIDNRETVENITESNFENIKASDESKDETDTNEQTTDGISSDSVRSDGELPEAELKTKVTEDPLTESEKHSEQSVSEKTQENAADQDEKSHDTFTASQTNFELPSVNDGGDNNWMNVSSWPFIYNFNESSGYDFEDGEEFLFDGCKYIRQKVFEDFGVNMTEKEIKETLSQIPKIHDKNDSEAEMYIGVVSACLNPSRGAAVVEENCGKIKQLVKRICTDNEHCKGREDETAAAVQNKLRELHETKDLMDVLEMVRICANQDFD